MKDVLCLQSKGQCWAQSKSLSTLLQLLLKESGSNIAKSVWGDIQKDSLCMQRKNVIWHKGSLQLLIVILLSKSGSMIRVSLEDFQNDD